MKITHLYLACFLVFAACCTGEPIILVKDGAACAEIVVGDNPDITIKHAADELKYWVKEISDAELPIVATPGSAEYKICLTSDPEILQKYPQAAELPKDIDGYGLDVDGKTLTIYGSMSKGPLNAVYRLLRKNTDIIWARPNPEYGTIFSKRKDIVFNIEEGLDIPKFHVRGWQVFFPCPTNEFMWNVRNCATWTSSRGNAADNRERPGWGVWQEACYAHNICRRYINRKTYWETHPEYYSMKNGKRIDPFVPKGEKTCHAQLCFTNENMIADFIKELEKTYATTSNAKSIAVCLEDNHNACTCPECMKDIVLPDGKILNSKADNFQSTRFYMFLNRLAKYMQVAHPGVHICTYAYHYAEIPPAIQVEKNIDIILCPIYKNVRYPVNSPENEYSWSRLRNWFPQNVQIVIYDYYGIQGCFPRAVDRTMAADFRYEYENKVYGEHAELIPDNDKPSRYTNGTQADFWDANAMYMWVGSQLLWDPYLSVDALRDEFLTRVYGSAAEDMWEFFEICERIWKEHPVPSKYNTSQKYYWAALAERGECENVRTILKRAAAKPLNPQSRKLVERLTAVFERNNLQPLKEECKSFALKQKANPEKYANLLQNPKFEDLGNGPKDETAMADWKKSNFASWVFWCRNYGTCGVVKEGGSNVAFMDTTDNACFLQQVETEPHAKYIVRCRVKIENPLESDATISLRWRRPDGNWANCHDTKFYAPKAMKAGEWHVIEGFFAAPDNVGKMSLQLGTTACKGKVYFDDAELYKVE